MSGRAEDDANGKKVGGGEEMSQVKAQQIMSFSDARFFFLGSYSKRGGQSDNRTAGEDSGRKGSGSSTTKVPASPLVPTDRKKSATPSTVRQKPTTAYMTFATHNFYQKQIQN